MAAGKPHTHLELTIRYTVPNMANIGALIDTLKKGAPAVSIPGGGAELVRVKPVSPTLEPREEYARAGDRP